MRTCLSTEVAPQDPCNQEYAEHILSQTCEDMQYVATNPKADGGWFAWMHCQFGVLHFCDVPACEEDINPMMSESCVYALGSQGCAQCEYYRCVEEQFNCGPYGYLEGFVGKYCDRFTQVTYPRMSPLGQIWMEGVRECLITRLESGMVPGEDCASVKSRGLADHKTCYLDNGICQLPLSDWLGITATLSPHEFPFFQAISVGIPCLKTWFGFN